MDIYITYWTNGNRYNKPSTDQILTYIENNIKFLRKNYENINLITDLNGSYFFKNLRWSNIYTPLEKIEKKYSNLWNFGKLYAYNFISKKNKPFIHLDYDFFILKKIPENVTSRGVFVQSKEVIDNPKYYDIENFETKCKNKYFAQNLKLNFAYNCGIIGGTDLNFFDLYSESAIKLLEDIKNESFWFDCCDKKCQYNAMILEQYYLAISSIFLNREVSCLFDILSKDILNRNYGWYNPNDLGFLETAGCFHPFGDNKYKSKDLIDNIIFNNV